MVVCIASVTLLAMDFENNSSIFADTDPVNFIPLSFGTWSCAMQDVTFAEDGIVMLVVVVAMVVILVGAVVGAVEEEL